MECSIPSCKNLPEPNRKICRPHLERQKRYATARKERLGHEKFCELQREMKHRVREEVIAHYGGKCACCGESATIFLSIDHVNNDGSEHRKDVRTSEICYWLRKNNFPEGFQVLCYNCNHAKFLNGGICPHQEGKESVELVN